jgi:uncharacterized protein (DUF2147 family)
MKKALLLLVMLCFGLSQTWAQQLILGEWLTQDGRTRVFFYHKNNEYFGQVIRTSTTPVGDSSLTKPLATGSGETFSGTEGSVLTGFQYVGENTWEYGKFYDATKAKMFSCILKLKNARELEVRIYPTPLFFHRTLVWTRSDFAAQVIPK